MAWVKLDDAMPHHPKVMAAGPQAFALDVAGIAYSNRYGTDGFIADAVLPAVLPCLSQPRKWAALLVTVGRWHRDDQRGGWTIHDVHDYQPTGEEQKELSKKRAAAGKAGGTKSGQSRRNNAATKHEADVKQVASTEPNPGPVRPLEASPLPPPADADGGTNVTKMTPRARGTNPRAVQQQQHRRDRQVDQARSFGHSIASIYPDDRQDATDIIAGEYRDDGQLRREALEAYDHYATTGAKA